MKGTYLAESRFDTDEFLGEYDRVNAYCKGAGALDETEDVLYFRGFFSNYIGYYDKVNEIGGVLCGKPECLHNDKTCNAWVSPSPSGLNVYEENEQMIYWAKTLEGETLFEKAIEIEEWGESWNSTVLFCGGDDIA